VVVSILLATPAFASGRLLGARIEGGTLAEIPTTGQPQEDWSSATVAWWDCEEASGTLLANDTSSCGAAGTDCDLTDNSAVARSTTAVPQGTRWCDFDGTDYYDCSTSGPATCEELDTTTHITYGGWFEADTSSAVTRITHNGGSPGYRMNYDGANDRIVCRASGTSAQGATNDVLISTTYHVACVFDDTANTMQPYVDGATSGAGATIASIAASTDNFTQGCSNGGGTCINGRQDEMFVSIGIIWDATEICRACACGIDQASARCMCDATTPANFKSCSVDADCRVAGNTTAICSSNGVCDGYRPGGDIGCGNCTATACNAAAPS
jgi:hypothetical protein